MNEIPRTFNILFNKLQYKPEEPVILKLEFIEPDKYRFHKVEIIVHRITNKRNQFAYTTSSVVTIADEISSIEISLTTPKLPTGCYGIRAVNFYDDSEKLIDQFPLKSFWPLLISEEETLKSAEEIETIFNELKKAQDQFQHYPIKAKSISKNKPIFSYNVLVFCVGSFVDTIQYLEGYRIIPIKNELDYRDYYNIVKKYLHTKNGMDLDYKQKFRDIRNSAQPIYVIDFHSIIANDSAQAVLTARIKTEFINIGLAFQNRQKATIFCSFALNEHEYYECFEFHPQYLGNLVGEFSNTLIAEKIERYMPSIENNSWGQFLLRNYANALNEANQLTQIFYLWSILDLIAQKHVLETKDPIYDHHNNVLKKKGKLVTTESSEGRAFKIMSGLGIPELDVTNGIGGRHRLIFESDKDIPSQKNDLKFSLWEFIKLIYKIRNIIAHDGILEFSRLPINSEIDTILRKYKDITFFPMLKIRFNEYILKLIEIELGV